MEIVTSWERKGREMGQREGRQEEAVKLLSLLLRRRLGKLPADVNRQLKLLPLADIESLFDRGLDFSTMDDLNAWLAREAKFLATPQPEHT
jgi:hypothetical protein